MDHKPGLDAMKREAVVKAGPRQLDERRRMLRCDIGIEREDDVAFFGRDTSASVRRLGSEFGEFIAGWFTVGRHMPKFYGAQRDRARR